MRTEHFTPSGQAVMVEEAEIHQKGNGSFAKRTRRSFTPEAVARLSQANTPTASEFVQLVDVEEQLEVALYPSSRSKSTVTMPADLVKRLREGNTKTCSAAQDQSAPILGFAVLVAKDRRELPNGDFTTTLSHLAPELDCFPLRVENSRFLQSGTPAGKNVRTTVWIRKGEPGAQHFAVPAEYVERRPSEARAAEMSSQGMPCEDCARDAARLDHNYRQWNKRK